MRIIEQIKKFRNSRKKYIVTIVLAVIVVILFVTSYFSSEKRKQLIYADHLEETAVTVNGQNLTLREVAFYVAYEESEVEKQAQVYDAENTKKYWNLHIDGVFVKYAARNAAIQMAIHDELFCQMAQADGYELNEEDQKNLKSAVDDFWSDLTEDEKEKRIGITYEDIQKAMEKAALAQKYQYIYEAMHDADEGDYAFSAEAYEALLEENDYKINKDIWERIDFGNVTLNHSETND